MPRRKAGLLYTFLMGGMITSLVAPRKMRRLGYFLRGDFMKLQRDVIDVNHKNINEETKKTPAIAERGTPVAE
jgi:hypothetical protein